MTETMHTITPFVLIAGLFLLIMTTLVDWIRHRDRITVESDRDLQSDDTIDSDCPHCGSTEVDTVDPDLYCGSCGMPVV